MANKVHSGINKPFCLFLLSQGISNLGDAFQLIAATSLLVMVTGSGLSAAFGLVCSPIASILFSPLAGHISDMKWEKQLLVIVDLLRGLVVILFISKHNVIDIYILMIALSILDMLYNPPRKKLVANILSNSRLMSGNSIINGVSGVMFIVGPVLAGLIISKYGVNIAFFINAVSFFISALTILVIKYKPFSTISANLIKIKTKVKRNAAFGGFNYFMQSYALRRIASLGTMLCFVTTSVNIAFYPYAFDILKISNMTWGSMMSIFYGANVVAMFITILAGSRIKAFYKAVIPSLFAVISVIWVSYGFTGNIDLILLLQLIEGTILSFLNTVLTTHLQTASRKDILGRVLGINDFINSLGKIMGIIFTYSLISFAAPSFIFFICAIVLFSFVIYSLVTIRVSRFESI